MADASLPITPPTPDDCTHPEPVSGVLAQEFSHYDGAQGPEGTRRTVTYYGPVIGGLPISAIHCEACGQLNLRYPDGRREERRLFPGPQPGLLARAEPIDPRAELFGRQARVSGLSVSRELVPVFAAAYPAPTSRRRAQWQLPDLGVVDILSVVGLVATAIGLLIAAVLAVYDVQTSTYEYEAVWATVGTFFGVVLLQVVSAAVRHWFGQHLAPSVAVTERATPHLDGATKTVVGLLVVVIVAMFIGAVLATYDFFTSSLEKPVFITGVVAFALALIVAVANAAINHFAPPRDEP